MALYQFVRAQFPPELEGIIHPTKLCHTKVRDAIVCFKEKKRYGLIPHCQPGLSFAGLRAGLHAASKMLR